MTKPRILLSIAETDDAFASMVKALSPHAKVIVAGLEDYSLKGVDVFVGKKTDAAKLAEADRLKAVFAYKTGVDDFPVRELGERGILLVNSHVNSRYIAEYAFGLAIALVSRIAEFDRKMRQGDWDIEDPYWKSLFAMKAGLVGFGHIGRELHALLAANGIPTMTIDRGKDYPDGVELVPSLEELCRKADILFLSLPRTSATNGMFGKEIFSQLKGKFIVNVGRSNCIDEGALYHALSKGGMAGAAIDTWREKARKPGEVLIPFDHPFQNLDNILLSSHKAMQLIDGHSRYVEDITARILLWLDGKPTGNEVDCSKGY